MAGKSGTQNQAMAAAQANDQTQPADVAAYTDAVGRDGFFTSMRPMMQPMMGPIGPMQQRPMRHPYGRTPIQLPRTPRTPVTPVPTMPGTWRPRRAAPTPQNTLPGTWSTWSV